MTSPAKSILHNILHIVFSTTSDAARATRFTYQFSSEELLKDVAEMTALYDICLERLPDNNGHVVGELYIQDVPLSKGRIMLYYAKMVAQYKTMKKKLDFVPLGRNWKDDKTLLGDIVPKYKLYEGSYGAEVDNKK